MSHGSCSFIKHVIYVIQILNGKESYLLSWMQEEYWKGKEGDWHRGEGIIYARRERGESGMDVVYRGLAIAFIPSLHYSCARGVIAAAEGISRDRRFPCQRASPEVMSLAGVCRRHLGRSFRPPRHLTFCLPTNRLESGALLSSVPPQNSSKPKGKLMLAPRECFSRDAKRRFLWFSVSSLLCLSLSLKRSL